jgi:hypothetical protein
MILGRGENIVLQGRASLMLQWGPNPGALYLTNVRIVFEAGAGGPTPYTAFEQSIDRVMNVHVGSSWKKKEGRHEFLTLEGGFGRAVFDAPAAQNWAAAIVATKSSTPHPPPPPPPPPPPGTGGQAPVVVQVQAPAAPQIMMHCRNCGNLFDVTKGRCDRCGAPPT